ncbi:MAG: UDP-N-acetylenolpyruvoylglucosamine reductase [Candidatus Nealsonbacteria bacterium CG09_land_8_20_14_0_10_42_14]|uniref:UDP-N-acetylenolpyruvoylglucosamine reductase n=1 Tax=Candidatus Nealsonbacteria bacterium CG09_land_8_20_14_0_10_42_14 TaxID=1974707 RepID=A0A2H0WXB9_9BACT|nr:MAG: UDP-N-acetylenolpyruvoylglucosamine reductase [Candidatus Nealsonbacteria bacterium CG09_land_8_20_14_0_10_42_14]
MNRGFFPPLALMRFQRNVLLKNHTTFKIGGPTRYFLIAKNKKEVIYAVKRAKKENLPFFILGAGSNVLFSDKGYRGLVIKFQGPKLSKFVQKGLEWTVGIPGTTAGAIQGNAGAFGESMKDAVEKVEVFDAKDQKVKIFKNKDCRFGYRTSIFKKNPNLIILSAEIKSKKSHPQKIKEYLKYRQETQPLNYPSAGSIFKNSKNHSAAYFIEKCNLKGKMIGRAQISQKHANFIINLGGASSEDVLKLINLAKRKVKNKFGINLEEEIQILK